MADHAFELVRKSGKFFELYQTTTFRGYREIDGHHVEVLVEVETFPPHSMVH